MRATQLDTLYNLDLKSTINNNTFEPFITLSFLSTEQFNKTILSTDMYCLFDCSLCLLVLKFMYIMSKIKTAVNNSPVYSISIDSTCTVVLCYNIVNCSTFLATCTGS